MTDTARTPGIELKVERVRALIPQGVLASAMGITSSRLSRIEADPSLTPRMRERYMTALDTCRTSGTGQAA